MTRTFATIVVIACVASGCMFGVGSFQSGESLQEKQIQQITPGTTTKQQILDLFGPPAALARKGSALIIPSTGPGKVDYPDVQGETFFELFSSKRTLTERHVVYFYSASETKSTRMMVLFAGTADNKVATDRLWILIDDGTGIVLDYIFRKAQ